MKNASKILKALRGGQMLILAYVALSATFSTTQAQAEDSPGDLDPSFGIGGKVTTDFAVGLSDLADAVVLQQDGKIVTAGLAGVDFALARFNPDGTLDTGFGTGGKVTTDFAGFDQAFAIMLQPDGKLVAAGVANQGSGDANFALARYNPDGALDTSFGSGGKVSTDFAGRDDVALDLVLQADGKIVVVGRMALDIGPPHGLSLDFALARYNPDGTLDTSFGSEGKVTTDFADGSDGASTLILQPDGMLVAAGGASGTTGFPDFALARYNSDGTLDTGFGIGGKVTTDFGGFFDEISEIRLQQDGKLVAAGTAGSLYDFDFALARYNPSGSLDSTFGTGGKVMTDFFGCCDSGSALVIQSNGKLVAAGTASNDFALARYNPDGTLDMGFGTGGEITTDFAGSSDGAFALLLQPDGKLVAAGTTDDFALSRDFALARYLGDPTATEVSIDFKLDSSRNSINLKSNGVIPVVILSTPEFDAISVDPLSVKFGPSGATEIHDRGHFEDIDGDGDLDLVLHFRTQESGISAADTEACLTAQTFSGVQIQGCDAMTVR